MSLSSFLEKPDVRERFRQEFKKPRLAADRELLASPLSERYSLVGTAFDYLLRFYIQRLNPDAISRSWVAEAGLRNLREHVKNKPAYDYDLDTGKLSSQPDDGRLDKASNIFNKARVAHEQYLASGRMTDQVLKSTIYLAQLDVIFRSGFIDENLGVAYPEDVQDLRNLISLVKQKEFLAKSICLLNPTFGKASRLVGGADADIFIDGMLIDIKTTKNFVVDRGHFNQLIGYSVLHKLSGFDGTTTKPRLSRVAIYFSRHAHLEIFDLSEIINPKTFPRFVKWFSETAKQDTSRITRRSTGRAKTARR